MVPVADDTCGVFDRTGGLDENALNQFVVGADPQPRAMTAAEVRALGDPFAALFAKGTIPRTAQQVIEKLKAAAPKKSPLQSQASFIVGEGSQVARSAETATVQRSLRFLVTLGDGPKGPDVLLSAADPAQAARVEVMAWDEKAGGFNYYRSAGGRSIWMLAGNSRDALRDSSRGKGPFESHPSGGLIMKELKSPWVNWHSPDANIPESVFAPNDHRRKHEWFTQKEPAGALTFEFSAARPAMERWAAARFASLKDGNGPVTRPRHIMEQILGTIDRRRSTVNLTTSHVANEDLRPSSVLDLPVTFFIDSEGLSDVLGLTRPPGFTVSGAIYRKCLTKFRVRMEDGEGFVRKGDTHFCFLVPERAFEDQVVLRKAIEIGLLSKRLAACLLMVDPWNPIFSERRAALLRHVPATARLKNRKSRFSQEMVDSILAAAKAGPKGTPEAEFAERWKVGPGFAGPFNRMLSRYYRAVTNNLKKQAAFDDYFKLAEERRQTFNEMPISEFPLLLPHTNIKRSGRRMRSDGSVGAS